MRRDGPVEAAFEGADDAVAHMIAFCREAATGTRVTALDESDEDPEGIAGFDLR